MSLSATIESRAWLSWEKTKPNKHCIPPVKTLLIYSLPFPKPYTPLSPQSTVVFFCVVCSPLVVCFGFPHSPVWRGWGVPCSKTHKFQKTSRWIQCRRRLFLCRNSKMDSKIFMLMCALYSVHVNCILLESESEEGWQKQIQVHLYEGAYLYTDTMARMLCVIHFTSNPFSSCHLMSQNSKHQIMANLLK